MTELPNNYTIESNPSPPKSKKFSCLWGCLILIVFLGIVIACAFPFIQLLSPRISLPFHFETKENKVEKQVTTKDMNSDELIEYFIQTTTIHPDIDDYSFQNNRWTKNTVSIALSDSENTEAISVVDKFITFFNSISAEVKLQRVSGSGDIFISLSDSEIDSAGKAGVSSGADCEIDKAEVSVSEQADLHTALDDNLYLERVIVHELRHALGFIGHYDDGECVIMRSKICQSDPYSYNEQKMIEFMYGAKAVPICSNEDEIRTYLENYLKSF